VSSTRIRRAVRRGDSVQYLVPGSVLDYIRQERLYTED
jgi:nicotinamide mononucleotide adenylyltransferase